MAQITFPLDIPEVTLLETESNEQGDDSITVESTGQATRCRQCGRDISQFHGYDKWTTRRHLSILGRRAVSRQEAIGYEAVVGVLERYMDAEIEWNNLVEWGTMGIDESALRQGRNRDVAVLTGRQAHGQVRLLAVLPDQGSEGVCDCPAQCRAGDPR